MDVGSVRERAADASKVLVRLPNWLGDIMMALPALQALRAALPNAEIVAMVRPDHVELVGRVTGLNGVIVAAARNGSDRYRTGLAVIRELRNGGFDTAVVLAPSFEAALTVWLAGIKVRVGHDTDYRGIFLNRVVAMRDVHQSDAFLDVVAELAANTKRLSVPAGVFGGGSADQVCRFVCAPKERDWADRFFSEADFSSETRPVFINPAAAKRPRAWSAEKFVKLVDILAAHHPKLPVIVHHHHPFELPDGWPGRTSAHILSGASLMELAAVVERCRLYVGNNSGPMHVAAALGVPTIAVYGSTSPALTSPRGAEGARHVSVSANFNCSPCRERFFEECPSPPSADERPPCLNAISIETVVEAVEDILATDGPT